MMEWMPHPHMNAITSGEAVAEAEVVVMNTCRKVPAPAEETSANMRARLALITRGEEILTSGLGLNLNLPNMKEGRVVIHLVEEALVGSPRSMKLIDTKTHTRRAETVT
jgi:hypothetical protein